MKKFKTRHVTGHGERQVESSPGYDVNYFATKHGITRKQARDLIGQIGNDRQKLTVAAVRLARR